MFEKIIFKNEKYKQIYDDILLNCGDVKKAKMFSLKQFLTDNYNQEIKKIYNCLKLETKDYKIRQEIIEDTGDIKYADRYFKIQKIKKECALLGIGIFFCLGAISDISNGNEELIQENAITYEKEIAEYNEKLDEYINNLDLEGLNDLEIFMLVMNDMWKSIDGYGTPQLDVHGYTRLDIQEGSSGVCRNMADDITAKLNAINPAYNARNVILHCEFGNLQAANIETCRTEEYIKEQEILQSVEEEKPSISDKIFNIITGDANHMMTLVDIPDKDITLVIDPTNIEMGVLRNGKIIMFNDENGVYDITRFYNYLYYGDEDTIDLMMYQLRSFGCDESYEKLNEEYGVDAQNEALENVRYR